VGGWNKVRGQKKLEAKQGWDARGQVEARKNWRLKPVGRPKGEWDAQEVLRLSWGGRLRKVEAGFRGRK